jgi:hypothetical protein
MPTAPVVRMRKLTKGGSPMNEITPGQAADEMDEGIPIMQQVLDNPFLLLFLGIAMPTVLYIVWGVMEIITIPVAK